MARKKKGSGKARKKSAGKKRASGASSARKGSARKAAGRAGKKAGKKSAAKRAPARKKAAKKKPAKKRPAKKKAAKKQAPRRKPAKKKAAPKKAAKKAARKKSPARAAKPARKRATRKPRGPVRDAAFFDHFRRKLIEQRENIVRRLDELRDELRGLEQTPRELEEWAQEEKDRDILIRLEDRETDELRKIQAALGLIDQREYGLCQICGKPIPRARLEELPTAFRCVDCTP